LIVRGHISFVGKEYTILVNRGLSGAQRATAYNYDEGDVIRFTRGSKQFAITKGDYARVEAVDREANLLTVRVPDGRRAEYRRSLPRRGAHHRTRGAYPVPSSR